MSKGKPNVPKVFDDKAVDNAPLKELRVAYKALRDLHITREIKMKERDAQIVLFLRRLKEQGKYTGGLPLWGFKLGPDGEVLIEKKEEQLAIVRAQELRKTDSRMSLRAIADTLAEEGFLSRAKRTFVPSQIKRLLARSAEAKEALA